MSSDRIPQIKSMQIVAIRPEGADEQRLQFVHAGKEGVVPRAMYVVKVYLQEGIPATGQAVALYVGETWIRKYFAFSGGIFFNIYEPDFFQKNANATIRFTADHTKYFDSSVRLSMPVQEADAASADSTSALPTKHEALRV